MTKTFAVNENNDLYIDKFGNLAMVSGLPAVLQACEQAVKTLYGEMFLNTTTGMPNFQLIWDGSPNYSAFESALRKTLLSVVDVKEVASVTITVENNILSYTAEIVTAYGTGVING